MRPASAPGGSATLAMTATSARDKATEASIMYILPPPGASNMYDERGGILLASPLPAFCLCSSGQNRPREPWRASTVRSRPAPVRLGRHRQASSDNLGHPIVEPA